MTSIISLTYEAGCTFTSNAAMITVGNGGAFELTNNQSLSLNGSFTCSALSLSTAVISFANLSPGTAVSGTVTIPVNAPNVTTGEYPTITANHFSGTVMLQWPSSAGPQYQELLPGKSLTLINYTN